MPTAISSIITDPVTALKSLVLRDDDFAASAESILADLSLSEKVFLLSGLSFVRTSGITRHGLHPAKVSDGATDIRGDTVFNTNDSVLIPNPPALASTWDISLVEQVAAVLGREAKWKEVDVLLSPTLNLHRDPRGGRNQESYGEDPFLAGKMGAAFIRGIHSAGVATCAKHLVCNDSETGRHSYDSQVTERALREVHLRPFEIVMRDAAPAAIMTAYNRVNGIYSASNAHVMDIVRKDWGWEGLFMSDWFGSYDGITSLRAGNDLEMPLPATRGPKLLKAIAEGQVAESELDQSCLRVIRLLQSLKPPSAESRIGDRPSPRDSMDMAFNRRAAGEGIVLLRNEGILPLRSDSDETVAVIGSLATDPIHAHLIRPSYYITPLRGIRARKPSVLHAHGPNTHRVVPHLDERFTNRVDFKFWNKGERLRRSCSPVVVETQHDGIKGYIGRWIPGLKEGWEIEMRSMVTVPRSGKYRLSLIATADATVTVNGLTVFEYRQSRSVSIPQFLFEYHELAQEWTCTFEDQKSYDVQVVISQQTQTGQEPMAQGLMFGMIEDKSRDELIREALACAQSADKVLLFVGTTSEWEMEGVDRSDITLPAGQDELIRRIVTANPNTVVVNQSGAAVDLSSAVEAAAILHASYIGQEAGNALADVIFGDVNPSGRTTFSWPQSLSDHPTHDYFPHREDMSLPYLEDLANGYRGFIKAGLTPAYPFGHGLSYTSFEWTAPTCKSDEASVTIRNTGRRSGREVIQLYLHRGVDWEVSLEGFLKSRVLDPGETDVIRIPLTPRALSSWDEKSQRWIVEQRNFKWQLARSVSNVEFEVACGP